MPDNESLFTLSREDRMPHPRSWVPFVMVCTIAFVPALALGGSEDETQVERQNWSVYQNILFQL